jgi:uncharacterized protein (TIGR00251 family)
MAIELRPHADGLLLAIKVVPGASRDRIAGEYGGGLKVTVSKPPEGGAANDAVVELLAEKLGVPRSQLQITQGHRAPRKQVLILGLTAETIRQRLGQAA